MKKLLLILFTIVSVSVQAQYIKPNNSYGTISNRQSIDSTLLIPTGCGDPSLRGVDLKKVALYGDTCNNLLYKYNPKTTTWNVIGSGTGMDTAFYSSSATADTIIGVKGNNRFVIGIIYNKDGLMSGGIVTWDSLLTFDVTAAIYRKNAVVYNSPAGSITLDAADPTYNRIDLIVLDTTGSIRKVTGVPSANPAVPQIDPTYGIILTQVQVNANATTPANVSSSVVYDENTEFTTSAINATVNFDNTVNPFHLTKAADVTAASSGGYLQFVSSTVLNATDYNTIKFYIRLKTALAKRTSISVIFYNGSTNVSNGMVLSSTNGFDPTITGTYQNISIPMSDFNFSPSAFDRIRIVFNGSSFSSFYIDYVQLQAGVTNAGQDLNFVRNVYASGGNLYQTINGQNQLITPLAVGGGGISKLGISPYGLVKSNDSTYYVDSSLLLTKLTAAATYLTPSNANATYLKISDTTNKWIPKGSVFPTYVTKPILALNDSTLAFDSLNLTEIRYSLAARDTTKWTDTTLIDRKFLDARINPVIASVNTNTTAIAGKLSNITGLVTPGTNVTVTGSGTSGSPYVINSSGGGGGSQSVTEQKEYYHGEFWWNHGLDLSTGTITSDTLYDITGHIPIEGSTSITVSLTDSTGFTVGGWTYDSSLAPILPIRSAGSIGSQLATYTFTTPSNARYLIMYTRAHIGPLHADSSVSKLLRIQSTNPMTYNVPITPEQFTGTSDVDRINQAVRFARWTSSGVTLTGVYKLDSAIILSSGSTLILDNAKISMKYGMHDNMIRNEAVAQPTSHIFNRGNRKIRILGYGNAVMRGSTEAWGSSYPSNVNGQYWRANAILLANVEDFDISGITFKSLNASAIIPEQARMGNISHITFDNGGLEHLNQGGIILGRGDYNININNIRGVTQDDIVAVQNIPSYKGDSLYVLGTTVNYMPYVNNLDVYGINIRNVDRTYSNKLGTGGSGQQLYGSRIRVMAADNGKIHDVSIDGVSGTQEIYIQVPNNGYGTQNKNNVSNLTVSNTGQAPVYIERPISNSSFINVPNFDTSGAYQSVKLPDSSTNIYRKYYNSAPVFIDSVMGGTEYIHNTSGLTISTGLTNTAGTVTNNLSTGKSGGQSIYGGAAANENITIVPNAYTVSDNGKIYFGRALTNYYDVANGAWSLTTASSNVFANLALKSTSGASTDNVGMTFAGRSYIGWEGSSFGTLKIGSNNGKIVIVNSITPGAGRMATFDNGNMALGSIAAPNSNLQITSFATAYTKTAVSMTAGVTNNTIEVTATGQTITLPTAVGIDGREYTILYSASSGSATIATTSSQTFVNITGTPTTLTLSAPATGATTSYSVKSNGTNWAVYAKMKND